MSELSEKNPGRYRDMCVPHESRDAADVAVGKLLEAVKVARIENRIANVYVIVESRHIDADGEESNGMHTMIYGDALLSLPLVAQAFGAEKERHAALIAKAVTPRSRV